MNETGVHAILDIGTGSGCIAVAVSKFVPDAKVNATDISAEALEVAVRNAAINNTTVEFFKHDIFSVQKVDNQYAIIVSNPPYIAQAERKEMHRNVTDHEPHLALFVPDEDPLLFYKAISNFAFRHLCKNGLLFLEINESFGKETTSMLRNNGFLDIELRKDINGKDRMIRAKLG
jgi:release factor glutamine methyltransferase